MNRRNFLGLLGGLALSEAIPFNRVWSFPKNIVIPKPRSTSFTHAQVPMGVIRAMSLQIEVATIFEIARQNEMDNLFKSISRFK